MHPHEFSDPVALTILFFLLTPGTFALLGMFGLMVVGALDKRRR
jgi:hypothetical protein